MNRSRWLGGGGAVGAIAIDQGSKQMALAALAPGETAVVTEFFNWVLVFNSGVSFGLLADDGPYQVWLLSGMALAICAVLSIRLSCAPSGREALANGLIIGGALGNVIDRLCQGAVTDFLDFHVYGWHWPAFNLGDVAIFVGVALVLAAELTRKPNRLSA